MKKADSISDGEMKKVSGGWHWPAQCTDIRYRIDYGDCIRCNYCPESCDNGAISIHDGDVNKLPVIDLELCDGCGDSVEGCPVAAIKAI